jgi:hypothetical protein
MSNEIVETHLQKFQTSQSIVIDFRFSAQGLSGQRRDQKQRAFPEGGVRYFKNKSKIKGKLPLGPFHFRLLSKQDIKVICLCIA